MPEDTIGYIVVFAGLIAVAYIFEALRKAIGLLLIIVGTILTLTIIGALIGIPAILVGGLFLFAKGPQKPNQDSLLN